MASIIRIKRSSVSGNPGTLGAGELAYSALPDTGANGGDRLYIGMGTETTGNAVNHVVIGGKYYTDTVDAATSANTADTLVKRDGSGNFGGNASSSNQWSSGISLSLTGDGSASLTGVDGSGNVSTALTLATVNSNVGTYGSSSSIPVVTVNAKGLITAVTTASISTTLNVSGNTGTDAVALGSDTLAFTGTEGINAAVTDNTVTISINSGGIANDRLTNSSVTFGSTSVALGATSTTIAGLTSVSSTSFTGALTGNASSATTLATARNINGVSFNGSADITVTADANTLTGTTLKSTVVDSSLTSVGTIDTGVWAATDIAVIHGGTGTSTGSITGTAALTFTAAAGNNNVNLVPTGIGIVDVGGKRVGNAATPTQSSDLTTKAYVDSLSNGLDVKASVRAATTANITLSNTQTVDGVALTVGNRVLVKDQTTGSQNGIYVVASGSWTRATDFDNSPDIEVSPGTFFFVEEGTTQSDNGYVVSNDTAITIGTTAITFSQFSGAGQITAGDGLTKTGNTINAVGTTNRISVATDSIDISTNYVGQTSITTLGTIDTGTWNATTIGTTKGGTGLTSYATGDVLYASSANTLSKLTAGADGTVLQINASGVPVWGVVDGGIY